MSATLVTDAPSGVLQRLVSPVIVGREGEFRALCEAAAHPPSLVVVEGEAGVGKTRLMTELLRQPELGSHQRLVGRCQQLHERLRFDPFIQALRAARPLQPDRPLPSAAGALRTLLPDLDLPPLPLGDAPRSSIIERHLLFRGILDVLSTLGPTVLVLEDTHWADRETLDLIRYMANQLPAKLSVVVTYRREELAPGSPLISLGARTPVGGRGGKITLHPLPPADVRLLLGAILGAGEVSPDLAAFVHGRTEGIPFAIEEVLRLMIDRHQIEMRNGRWVQRQTDTCGTPTAIRDSVVERVGALTPEARSLVEASAVLVAAVAPTFLAAVAGLAIDDAVRALREALGSGLLVEDEEGRCAFRHVLAKDAVFESLPHAVREQLHRAAGREYERQEPGSLRTQAHHYRAAGEPRWISLAEVAADNASAHGDYATAARLLAQVLASEDLQYAERPCVALKLARAAYKGVVADPRVNALLAATVASNVVTGPVQGELRFVRGFLLKLMGDASAAQHEWRQAVIDLGSHPLAAQVMTHLADPWVFEGTLADHMMWLRRAATAASRCPEDVRHAVAVSRATILLYVGDRQAAPAIRSLELDGATGEFRRLLLWAHVDFAAAAFNAGRYAEAARYLAQIRRHAEAHEIEGLEAALDTCDLMLDWATGEWDELEERAARHADTTADVPRWSIPGTNIAACLALARGNVSVGERLARGAQLEARAGGVLPAYALACGLLARVDLDRGRDDAACHQAMSGVDALAAKNIWVWAHYVLPEAVEALLACGRTGDVAPLIERAVRGLTGRNGPAGLAATDLCRGQLAEHRGLLAEAAGAYRAAEQRFAKLSHLSLAAHAKARLAISLLRARDAAGQGVLNDAVVALNGLGAQGDINRIRRVLRRHSITVTTAWRGGRTGYGARTSPREMQVARMAADGLTNPEIARQLFLSPRTVEHHLGSVMRKLGVRSRVTLATRLHELGDAAL